MQSTEKQKDAVTFQGTPMSLVGRKLGVGDSAPAFDLISSELEPVSSKDVFGSGKRALLIVVPSLDTSVCSLEAQTFQQRLGELPSDVKAYIVSRDLPFAMSRWAGANDAAGLAYLSDFKDHTFGPAYGVVVDELGVLARAVFIVDANGRLTYVKVVKEIADQPDFDEVFAALR